MLVEHLRALTHSTIASGFQPWQGDQPQIIPPATTLEPTYLLLVAHPSRALLPSFRSLTHALACLGAATADAAASAGPPPAACAARWRPSARGRVGAGAACRRFCFFSVLFFFGGGAGGGRKISTRWSTNKPWNLTEGSCWKMILLLKGASGVLHVGGQDSTRFCSFLWTPQGKEATPAVFLSPYFEGYATGKLAG